MRTGREYLESLRDRRAVYLDGCPVENVTAHPAFAPAARMVAQLYDFNRDPAQLESMTYPENEKRASKFWLIPRSASDLVARRRAHQRWAELSFGLMGRTPDHVGGVLTGFAARPDVFARGGTVFADHVLRFYEKARNQDLYVSYTIVPPTADRLKPGDREQFRLRARAVGERDDGIVLRGAMMVGTGSVVSDYLFLSSIVPLRPGEEDCAVSVVMPINAPGLRLYPRRPYATLASSVYDYPLSSRFDETDSLVVLDDVFVPWEDVFVYRNIELTEAQWYETPSHVLGNFQAITRLWVKLEFMLGIIRRVCQIQGAEALPPVQVHLGELAAYVSALEAFVRAAEQNPVVDEYGVVWPNVEMVYAALVLQPGIYDRMVYLARELSGGSLITVPSSVQAFFRAETAEDARSYYRSPHAPAEERVKLLKLAWDIIGTEFAGRQFQYEMFYAGAPTVVKLRHYRAYGWERAARLVENCLAGYTLDPPPDS